MTINYISIIIPVRNEHKFVNKLLTSILNQDIDKTYFEVIMIDGFSTDSTKEVLIEYSKKYNFIKVLDNPQKTVPYALNIGLRNAKGDIIIRLDAHAEYPKNYISTLVYYLQKLNADNVGGVWETIPANNSLKAKGIALALSSSFGVGNATYRLNSSRDEFLEVDTVPFGCYRRDVFDRIGLFDEQLTRNQDNEFNERLRKAGGKIYLIPSLKIKYYARENYKKLYKMFFQYGYFGPLVDIKLKKTTQLRRYIPTVFVLSLVFPLLLSPLFYPFFYLWVFILSLYFVASASFATYECIKSKEIFLIPYVMWAYFVSHTSYGLGYLKGVLDFIIRKKHLKSKVDVELSR